MGKDEALKLAFEYIYDCDNKDPLVETLRQALERPQTPDDLLRQSEREGWRYAKECEAEVKRLRQALEQPRQVNVPEGWKLVPIEPTDAMLSVPVNIDLRECVTPGGVTGLDAVGLFRAWEAMIEAAPHPWNTTDMAHRAGGLSMEQEPVAFIRIKKDRLETDWVDGATVWDGAKLYTAPPKREWVGLTDEEIFDVIRSLCIDNETAEMLIHVSMDEYRAIEAKLKEKTIKINRPTLIKDKCPIG